MYCGMSWRRAHSGRRHTNTMGMADARESTIATAKAPYLLVNRSCV